MTLTLTLILTLTPTLTLTLTLSLSLTLSLTYPNQVRAFEPEAIFLSTGFDAHAQEEVQGS